MNMSPSKLAAVLSFAAAVAAIPTPAESITAPIPGYGMFVPQWEVETSPGHFEILNGTVQEVIAQAIAIEPTFEKTFSDSMAIPVPSDSSLSKRDANCNPRPNEWKAADAANIVAGVRYLRGVGGRPHMPPGPGYCSRVSCSYDSAIYMCNDKNYERDISTWDGVANSAQHIVNRCQAWGESPYYGYWVVGQNFESDSWNTIVRKDNC